MHIIQPQSKLFYIGDPCYLMSGRKVKTMEEIKSIHGAVVIALRPGTWLHSTGVGILQHLQHADYYYKNAETMETISVDSGMIVVAPLESLIKTLENGWENYCRALWDTNYKSEPSGGFASRTDDGHYSVKFSEDRINQAVDITVAHCEEYDTEICEF